MRMNITIEKGSATAVQNTRASHSLSVPPLAGHVGYAAGLALG